MAAVGDKSNDTERMLERMESDLDKSMTYAQNMKYQRKFMRFLVNKLHAINSMCDSVSREAGEFMGSSQTCGMNHPYDSF